MTFNNATQTQPIRRSLPLGLLTAAVMVGLSASGASATPALSITAVGIGQSATGALADPAKRTPDAVTVSAIDFKRGDGGSGKLILKFSGNGAAPDLRNMGSNVIVDVGNAQLPAALQRPMNVTDFATPVQRIEARATSSGTQLVLGTQGNFESMAYQSGNEYIVEIVPRAAAASVAKTSGKAPAMGAVKSNAASSDAGTRYSGKSVTFNFQDVPVRTVLQLIAEESGLNIVAADNVQGNVTLRLMNVPWDQALDLVLQAKSLDKRRNGNVVWVAPQKEIADFEQAKEDARINLEERSEKVTEYIPVNYASAEDIAKLLTEESKGNQGGGGGGGGGGSQGGQNSQDRGFLSSRGSLSYDKRTNTLLVVDIAKKVDAIKKLVQELDKPVDQVVIEARIVIANENVARELGARFGISGNRDNAYFSGNLETNTTNNQSIVSTDLANRNEIARVNAANSKILNQYQSDTKAYQNNLAAWQAKGDPTTAAPTPPTQPTLETAKFLTNTITRGLMTNLPAVLSGTSPGSLALSILNAGYLLDVELSAIQTQGRGEVISNPRIVTSNQKEAVIRQGKEIGYLTVSGGQGGNVPTVQFKEALLELKVTPTITNDGRVFLNMGVKKDELDGMVSLGSFGSVPQIAKREVNTAVLVEDGQTVVIGGVYEFSDTTELSKVPFLGDIPVLGNLFRNKNRSKSKAELLVFVTPKVMRVSQR
ncbi:AMIN domain-containing protein [Thermomonas sp.]|jgi:type IV pilus assembly protein PilQ|uniref:type IV pilus secretin PilQ n=3 Tax=Thermomonas sp. TaxID=1971895 RepID=UPI002C6F61CC|nr:AMIN domain-containing protein [Thermomonas sp.]HQA02357.1 secretin N-terminal domain-containing protein [Thermomonas sp.]